MNSSEINNPPRLTLAISKGRIFKEAVDLLDKSAVKILDYSEKSRKLSLKTNDDGLQVLVVRAADVPTYVEYGAADLGITGKDVLMEYNGKNYYELVDLGISKCNMMVASKVGFDVKGATAKVATKYPTIAMDYFARNGVQAEIIKLSGSMELAPSFGLADQIVDLVDTGVTLRENGLEATHLICEISSYLIVNKSSMRIYRQRIKDFVKAVEGSIKD